MTDSFDIIDYLSGLTNFVFDKAVLKRIALDCGVSNVTTYAELDDDTKNRCEAKLLETVINGPWSTASSTDKHGEYTFTVGSQTVTAAMIERIEKRLKELYNKLGETEKLEAMTENNAHNEWINEQG